MAVKKSLIHIMCNGCTREGVTWTCTGYICPIYSDEGRELYARLGGCPFNKEEEVVKKSKVRVGQQKQRRFR